MLRIGLQPLQDQQKLRHLSNFVCGLQSVGGPERLTTKELMKAVCGLAHLLCICCKGSPKNNRSLSFARLPHLILGKWGKASQGATECQESGMQWSRLTPDWDVKRKQSP